MSTTTSLTPPTASLLSIPPSLASMRATPASDRDTLLERADFTAEKLRRAVTDAEQFHAAFRQTAATMLPDRGMVGRPGKAEQKFIRQAGGIAAAVVAKLGSNSVAKRRPDDNAPFLSHVQSRLDAGEPLLLRLGAGPVKNVQHYGAQQAPDLAEFLMLTQLARTVSAVATLYPHGVKVQMVPDDKRGGDANLWPPEYGQRYIGGLQRLTRALGHDGWLSIENGQERLYAQYRVPEFKQAAEETLRRWADSDPAAYQAKMAKMAAKAGDNLVGGAQISPAAAEASAWRYLVALKAEEMSGIFAPRDAFPLRYGNHPNSFQLYTMGSGLTKLPWQVALPVALLAEPAATAAPAAAPQRPSPPPHRSAQLAYAG